jgi:hypothetical protein
MKCFLLTVCSPKQRLARSEHACSFAAKPAEHSYAHGMGNGFREPIKRGLAADLQGICDV